VDKKMTGISQEVEKRLDEIFSEAEPVEELFDDIPEAIEETDFIDDYSILKQLKAIVLSIDWEIKDEYLMDLINEAERLKEEYKNERPLVLMFQMLISIAKYLQKKKTQALPDSVTVLKSVFKGIERIFANENISEAEKEQELSRQLAAFNALKMAIQEQAKKPKKEEKEPEKIIEKAEFKEEPVVSPHEYAPLQYATPSYEETQVPAQKEGEISPEEPELKEEKLVPSQGFISQEYSAPEPKVPKFYMENESEEVVPKTTPMEPHEAFFYALEEIKEAIRSEFRAIRAELKLWRESQQR